MAMRARYLFLALLLAVSGCTRPATTLPMEGTAERGQRLVVFPPVVENAPAAAVPTLQGAFAGSVLTHMGDNAISSRVGWDGLQADFEALPRVLFEAARSAFQAKKRDIEDREIAGRDSTLHRDLDALGDRMLLAYRLLHLDVAAPSHLLVSGVRLQEPDAFSSRRIELWAFVVDRTRHRLAFAMRMEFSASDTLYRQAERLLHAGRDVAARLNPWFPRLPPAPVVRVPAQPDGVKVPDPAEDTPEE